jgi:hypothetical protein
MSTGIYERARATFYGDPEAPETFEDIDPLIRATCERICGSGWLWTAESCQGHPDDTSTFGPWADNVRPMIRFVCAREHAGHLFDLLLRAVREEPGPGVGAGGYYPFELWPCGGISDEALSWLDLLVYVKATTVGQRDRGLECFARLAELACGEPPGS